MNEKDIGLILIPALMITMLSGIAGASTISFTDVSCLNSGAQVCSTTVYVYYPNGSLAGVLNGTSDSTILVDVNQSLNLYLKPNSVSLLNNPSFTFQWVLNSLQMFFGLLLIFSVFIGGWYIIKRLFMGGSGGTAVAPGGNQSANDKWRRWK